MGTISAAHGTEKVGADIIIAWARHPDWLTNTYLVSTADASIFVDAGMPLSAFPAVDKRAVKAILLTHNHHDHICDLESLYAELKAPIFSHKLEVPPVSSATMLQDGQELAFGSLSVRAIHTPGHTRGHLAFLINGAALFTGDLLFHGSVGGTRAPNHADVAALRTSILEKVLHLGPEIRIFPGHQEATSVAEEAAKNKIIRAWRGEEKLLDRPCTFDGKQAHVLAECRDYDGDSKVWLRYDGGGEDVVAGSDLSACPQ